MERFVSPLGEVELTDEREQHIMEFHPEMRSYRRYFSEAIAKPDTIRRSVFDTQVRILYHFLKNADKYLAIVVKTNHRKFILTAYTTHKIKH